MGVEVAESKLTHISVETGGEENSSLKENGKEVNQVMELHEPIKFGSHGIDEPVKGEVYKGLEVSFPKDAVDEWPAPQQIHSFYFVKYRPFEDQKIKAKLDQADKELHRMNRLRSQLIEKLRAKKDDRKNIISELKARGAENKQFRMAMDEKRKQMEPLQQALGQLRGTNYGGRDRRSGLCSSEDELNDLIKSLEYRIQHESIHLNEEKQILREIKLLEGTREKVIANSATRAKIQESMGEKEDLQDQVKLIGVDMHGVRKEQQEVKVKVKQLEDEKEVIDKEIKSLEEELTAVTEKRDGTFENIHELRKQREQGNSSFVEYRKLLSNVRDLAAKKDVNALKDLSETEVNKFISCWSSSKDFREDYERRILPSLDFRQLSRDGRMRNSHEKPLLVVETPVPAETELVSRTNVKQPKEDSSSPSQPDTLLVSKVQKEKNVKTLKQVANQVKETPPAKTIDVEDAEEFSVMDKLHKDPPKVNEIDEQKLKEMKREEEKAKAKQALDRKKKLKEKADAKAAIRAQKEAEKKEKDLEKKLKKKAGYSVAVQETEEQTESAAEVADQEKVEETVETPVPQKNKDRKENTVRYRKHVKGPDSLPKNFLKRKKATNYWMWAAPALAIVLLILVGYNYLSQVRTN